MDVDHVSSTRDLLVSLLDDCDGVTDVGAVEDAPDELGFVLADGRDYFIKVIPA